MANPAAQIRAAVQAQHPGASIIGRGRNFIRHRIGNRTIIDHTIGPLHVDGGSVEINTDLVASNRAEWLWMTTAGDYRAHMLRTGATLFSDGQTHLFTVGSHEVSFQPLQLQWTNDANQISAIADPAAVAGVPGLDDVTFPAAFGIGRDFLIRCETGRMSKRLTLPAALPTPPAFITNGANPALKLQFIFQKSTGLSIWIGGSQWNESSNASTTQRVEFRDSGGAVRFSFAPAVAFDANGQIVRPRYDFRKSGPNLIVEIRVPYAWLQTAVYPVIVDPTVDYQVGAGADDAEEDSALPETTNISINRQLSSTPGSGASDWVSERFTGVTIDDAATIDVAYMENYFKDGGSTTNAATIFGHDVANPSAPTTGFSSGISTLTKTTASVSWTGTHTRFAFNQGPSIVSIIQELVDTYSYASGAAMQFIIQGTGSTMDRLSSYDDVTTQAAKLHIEFSSGAQVIRPNADVTVGNWSTNTGATTNLYQAIDEATFDDADFIRSDQGPSSSATTTGFQTATDPGVHTGHILRYRYQKSNTDSQQDLTVRWKDSTTTIATFTHTNIGTTVTAASQTLSEAQAANITNYANVRVEWEANTVSPTYSFVVATNNATNNGQSLGLQAGSGAAEGNVAIAMISHRGGSTGTITAPGGWTQVGTQGNSGTTLAGAVFWRALDTADVGTPPTTHTFDFNTGSNVKGAAVMMVFSGIDNTNPILAQASQVNSSAANIAIPGLTVSAQDMMLVVVANKAHDNSHTQITNWTLDANANAASGGGAATTRNRVSGQYRTWTSANPGAQTVTSTTNAVSIGRQIALKPASSTRTRITWAEIEVPAATGAYTITAEPGAYTLTGIAANLEYGRVMAAAQGSYTLTGIAATLTKGRLMAADPGAYTLTGIAAGLTTARTMTAALGSYTLTGIDAALSKGFTMAADTGAYTLTGQAANLLRGYLVAAAQGGYTLTGVTANLLAARIVAAAQGTYTLTGIDATLQKGFTLTAAAGSYTLTGQAANLLVSRLLAGGLGSYTLTGIDATLQKGFTLTAAAGSYTLTGPDAGLLIARVITAAQGTYTLTGIDAILTYSGSGGFTMIASPGSYALTGFNAGLLAARILSAVQGAYILTGQDAGLAAGRVLAAVQGAYSLTGLNAGLTADRTMTAGQGAYVVTGPDAGLLRGLVITATAGGYTLTGQAANLLAARQITAVRGTYTLTGQAAILDYSAAVLPVTPDMRVFAIDGENRVFAIDGESRVFVIEMENRTFGIEG